MRPILNRRTLLKVIATLGVAAVVTESHPVDSGCQARTGYCVEPPDKLSTIRVGRQPGKSLQQRHYEALSLDHVKPLKLIK